MAQPDTLEHNPRGYAFVSFYRAMRRWRGWDWYAARDRYGLLPYRTDMLEQMLNMYDSLARDIDTNDMAEVRRIVQQVRLETQRSAYAVGVGIIGRRRRPDGTKESYLIHDHLGEEEKHPLARKAGSGGAAVHELIELDASLRPLLSPRQTEVWDVMLRYKTTYPADVASILGMKSGQLASVHQQKIYAKARKLKELI